MRSLRLLSVGLILGVLTVVCGAASILRTGNSESAQIGIGLVSGGVVALAISIGETFRDSYLAREADRQALELSLTFTSDLTGMNFSGRNLKVVNLQRRLLDGCVLSGSQLDGAILQFATLRNADLSFARLRKADLRGADLSGADLSQADLAAADLRGARLADADLTGANLTNARLEDVVGPGANFSFARLHGVRAERADFRREDFVSEVLGHSTEDIATAELTGPRRAAEIAPSRFRFVQGWRSNWYGADLSGCDLTGADFRFSTFTDGRLPSLSLRVEWEVIRQTGIWTTREVLILNQEDSKARLAGAELVRTKMDVGQAQSLDLSPDQLNSLHAE